MQTNSAKEGVWWPSFSWQVCSLLSARAQRIPAGCTHTEVSCWFALLSLLHFDVASWDEREVVRPRRAQSTLNLEKECERGRGWPQQPGGLAWPPGGVGSTLEQPEWWWRDGGLPGDTRVWAGGCDTGGTGLKNEDLPSKDTRRAFLFSASKSYPVGACFLRKPGTRESLVCLLSRRMSEVYQGDWLTGPLDVALPNRQTSHYGQI